MVGLYVLSKVFLIMIDYFFVNLKVDVQKIWGRGFLFFE